MQKWHLQYHLDQAEGDERKNVEVWIDGVRFDFVVTDGPTVIQLHPHDPKNGHRPRLEDVRIY